MTTAWSMAEKLMRRNSDNTFDNVIFYVGEAEYSLNRFWIEVYLPEYSNCAEYCFKSFDEMCDFIIPELGDSARHYLQTHSAEETRVRVL